MQKGNKTPDVSSKSVFDDDSYLKPVLDDDALLYSLEDLTDDSAEEENSDKAAEKRVTELEEELELLRGQFANYRLAVQTSMSEQLQATDDSVPAKPAVTKSEAETRIEDADEGYFTSYSTNSESSRLLPFVLVQFLADAWLKRFTKQCSRMQSARTRTEISSMITRACSKTRWSWMWAVELEFYPCSVQGQGQRWSLLSTIQTSSRRQGKTYTRMGSQT